MAQPNMLDIADPSWYPRVLRKLQEKYPNIASEVWSEAIADNGREVTEDASS